MVENNVVGCFFDYFYFVLFDFLFGYGGNYFDGGGFLCYDGWCYFLIFFWI